jgi:small-conductance mechanosensitive channel
LEVFDKPQLTLNLVSTGILIVVALLLRMIAVRAIRRSEAQGDVRRQWVIHVKNILLVLLILGLLFVWGEELRTFAVSLVAIAAAIVLATKELIQCALGGMLRAVARPFKVGDRIELRSSIVVRGDVINHSMLTTTLLEVGPGHSAHQYTGKTVVIPNSLFLMTPLFNESKSSRFRLHTFTVCRPSTIDVNSHRRLLCEAADEVCRPYANAAQKYLEDIGDIEGIEAPTAEPRVFVSMQNHDKVEFIVRVPVESLKAGRVEQAIIEKYIEGTTESAV